MARATSQSTHAPYAGAAVGLVDLDPDHPGFRDIAYRRRRDEIARLALDYVEGTPAPTIAYTDDEQAVWRQVSRELAPLHERLAARAYLDSASLLPLDQTRVPQLAELNERLRPATGFQMLPVAGLVGARTFLEYLARGIFLSTQYMRHPSRPLYTPEPDVIHELVGHAATLANPAFAELNRRFGEAALRAGDAALERIARVYWFTLEFGLCLEEGRPKAYGAGLLSSFGELGAFE
ncbi:MAG: phenylalanine 4-monooxygenase, partial [Deltaproteobacteria bacterium]